MAAERRIVAVGPPDGAGPQQASPRVLGPTFLFPGQRPNPPTGLVLTPGSDPGDVWVDASWTPPDPDPIAGLVTQWAIEVLKDGEALPTVFHPAAGNNDIPPFRIHNLSPDTLYHVSVRAITSFGATSVSLTGDVRTLYDNTPPPKITGLFGLPGVKSATVSWTPLGTIAVPFTGRYIVQVATDAAFDFVIGTYDNGNSAVLTVNNLTTGTPYFFRVFARSASNVDGVFSDSITLTPGLADAAFNPSDGSAPTAVTDTPTITGGPGYLFFKWTAISNPDVVTYEVHLSTTPAFLPGPTTRVQDVVGGNQAFVKNDASGNPLVYGTQYYGAIRVKDRDGYSTGGAGGHGASGVAGPVHMIQILAADAGFNVGNGNHVRNAAFGGVNSVDTTGGTTDTPFDDWYGYSFYPSTPDAGLTITQYDDDSFWGPHSARLQWTTNNGAKGLRQAVPTFGFDAIVWTANTSWVLSVWVLYQSGTGLSPPAIGADTGGFTDTPLLSNPTPVVGTWQRFDYLRVIGGADVTTNFYTYFTHQNGDVLVGAAQVSMGDVPSSFSPRPDEILARSIQAAQMVVGTITAASGIIGDLSADVITTGTLDASLATIVNLDASAIVSGTIGADIVYAGTIVGEQITGGTIDAAVADIINLDAGHITTGILDATLIGAGTIGAYLIQLDTGGVIRSANYVADTSGWLIDGAGNAELNSASIKANLTAGTINIDNQFFVDGTGNLQVIANIGIGADFSGGIFALSGGSYPYLVNTGYGFEMAHPSSTVYSVELVYSTDGDSLTEQRAGVFTPGGLLGYTGWTFFSDQFATCQARTSWGIFSSRTIKRDITNLDLASYDRLLSLQPVSYLLIDGDDHRTVPRLGLIAEDVEEVIPEVITPANGEVPMTLNYSDLTPLMIGKIQNLETRLAALEAA